MNLAILFDAPLAIQLHVYAAVLAFVTGLSVLWRKKGTSSHKRWGKIWVVLMIATALSSFFIHEIRLIGLFSPIHLISVVTLFSLYYAVKEAQEGKIKAHQRSMKSTFIGAMGIAGLLTFLPGRLMYRMTVEPVLEKLMGSDTNLPLYLLNISWQLPILIVIGFIAVALWKSVYRLFDSKNT